VIPLLVVPMAAGLGFGLLITFASRYRAHELLAMSLALGLGLLAYLVFFMGLVGFFTLLCFATAAVILMPPAVWGLWKLLLESEPTFERDAAEATTAKDGFLLIVCACLLSGVLGMLLLMIWVPPDSHQWDALSYHVAAPAQWLRLGRIVELPTDHHSYFPFLVQMLYLVGLHGDQSLWWPNANLFHFTFGLIVCSALRAMGARFVSRIAGTLAIVLFAVTPFAAWEATVPYVEIGQAAYVLLAIHLALLYRERRAGSDALLCGSFSGFALAVKTLSLIPVLGVLVLFFARRPPVRHALAFLASLVVLGSPFYVRSYLLTGNPVYPFAYSVFGGKYWDQRRAEAYAGEQRSYGLDGNMLRIGDDLGSRRPSYRAPSLADRVRNLALAPFAMVSMPRFFHNYNDPGPLFTLGFLPMLLPFLLMLVPRPPHATKTLLVFLGYWLLAWSITMQYARYLLPAIPLACLVGAAALERLCRRSTTLIIVTAAAVVLQLSVVVPARIEPWLKQLRLGMEDYLAKEINIYPSCRWLNANTKPADGVVLFEETRGFHIRRYVIWGNSLHSTYIPYERFRSGSEMVDWFLNHKIRYALVNLQFAPQAATPEGRAALRRAVAEGTEALLLRHWYSRSHPYGERWRALLADAFGSVRTTVAIQRTARGAVGVIHEEVKAERRAVAVSNGTAQGAVILRFIPREKAK